MSERRTKSFLRVKEQATDKETGYVTKFTARVSSRTKICNISHVHRSVTLPCDDLEDRR